MKSITVTTQNVHNYGAVLQSFALQQFQKELGIENDILDCEREKSIYEKIPTKFGRYFIVALVVNLFSFLNRKKVKRLFEGFENFIDNRLQKTRYYKSYEEVKKAPPAASFYLTGSDQVLNLRDKACEMRLLDFGDKGIRRYSYAASLGEYDWTESEREKFVGLANKFTMLSVRESSAKAYLESFLGKDCEVHLDPVFLLEKEKWEQIAVMPKVKEDYILVYYLIGNPKMQELILSLKEKTGYKVICLQDNCVKRLKGCDYVFDASPEEFLGWLLGAKCVLTTSFHGAAFSVLFEKPFYVLTKNYRAERILDLLRRFDLGKRLYKGEEQCSLEVDFQNAKQMIEEEREKSRKYFLSILETCN